MPPSKLGHGVIQSIGLKAPLRPSAMQRFITVCRMELRLSESAVSLWSGGLICCVTWFPAGQVTRYRLLLTGRQEALVCGVSHASHVSEYAGGLIYNALMDRATGKPVS